MKSESELTRLWCAKLEACGASVLPVVAGMRGRSGWPDRFIASAGVGVWIEFKGPRGKLSPLQRSVILGLIGNQQHVYVGRFVEYDDGNVYLVLEHPLTQAKLAECKDTQALLNFLYQIK